MAPLSNVSYVTQWQVWHKPYVREMLSEVERRAPEGVHWPLAVLASVASGYALMFLVVALGLIHRVF